MIKDIFEYIKILAEKPLLTITKVLLIVTASIILWKFYNNELEIYNPRTNIVMSKGQDAAIKEAIQELISVDDIIGAAVIVYQPDGVPKSKADLYYAKSENKAFEDILTLPFVKESRDLRDNTVFYNTLQYRESMIVDSSHKSYMGDFVCYAKDVKYMMVYGLYKYGSPYGVVVIAHKDTFDSSISHYQEYKYVKVLQDIMFNN